MKLGRLLGGLLALTTTLALGAGIAQLSYADGGLTGNNSKPTPPSQPGISGATLSGLGAPCAGFDTTNWSNIIYLGDASASSTTYAVWYLVDTGIDATKTQTTMPTFQVLFSTPKGAYTYKWDNSMKFSTIGGGLSAGWVIVTPSNWTIVSGNMLGALKQFNLNGCGVVKPTQGTGTWTAKASVLLTYNVVTYQPMWQKTYQPYYQQTIQPYQQKTYTVVRQKTVQPYTQKTCTYAKISSPGKASSSRMCGTSYASTDKSKAKCSAATVVKSTVVRDVVVSKKLASIKSGQTVITSDKTLQTALISDSFVRNDTVGQPKQVTTPVTRGLTVTIRDAKGAKVWTGSLSDAAKQQTLKAGNYTATLTLKQHGKSTTNISTVKFTVTGGANTMVDFGRQPIKGADQAKYLDKKYLPDTSKDPITKAPITLKPINMAPIQQVTYKTDKVLPAKSLKPTYTCK